MWEDEEQSVLEHLILLRDYALESAARLFGKADLVFEPVTGCDMTQEFYQRNADLAAHFHEQISIFNLDRYRG